MSLLKADFDYVVERVEKNNHWNHASNISEPFPKQSYNPSITVRKTSGYLDDTEKALVATTYTVVKEGNTDMGTKPNLVKKSITTTIYKKNIDTVNKT